MNHNFYVIQLVDPKSMTSSCQKDTLPPVDSDPIRLLHWTLDAMSELSRFLIPHGFRFGAAKAGLKASGRTDFALIVTDQPASAAAAFTANRVTAAPLIVDKQNLKASGGRVRVVAINAGNANCAAGQAGLEAARATCASAAQVFGCPSEQVFPSSTGVIGVPLPFEKLVAAMPALAARLGSEGDHFAEVPLFLFAFVQGDPTGGSIYPAVWSAQLAARAHGVGSSITAVLGFWHPAETFEILGVPTDENWIMACCVSFGYPTGRWGVAKRRPVQEVAYRNRWGGPIGFTVDTPLWSPGPD